MRRFVVGAVLAGCALGFLPGAAWAQGQMSESERKASARAAFAEGVELQDKGKPAEALKRFEAAQSLFDAPTHLLHIAECQALTGKLVEAQETYTTLERRDLGAGAPDAFKQAQSQGRAELQVLKPRIPTLRVLVKPEPETLQSLVVTLNDQSFPGNVAVVARPVNPGSYKASATATGYATSSPQSFVLAEKEHRTVELVLQPSAIGASTPVPMTPPGSAPPPAAPPAAAPAPYEQPQGFTRSAQTNLGLLFGAKLAGVVPGGNVTKNETMGNYTAAGAGFGLEGYLRFARVALLGLQFDWASLGGPSKSSKLTTEPSSGVTDEYSTRMLYVGPSLGLVPNIDRVSFIGDVGVGYRRLSREITYGTSGGSTQKTENQSFGGADFMLNAGLSIPAGPIRFLPRVGVAYGSFDKLNCGTHTCSNDSSSSHVVFTVGLGIDGSVNLGKPNASTPISARAAVPANGL